MKLSPEQRTYLVVAQGIVPFVINFVLNGVIGLLTFRGVDPVPTWAVKTAAGPDLIGTCFFLPAITCLLVTPLVRRNVRSGTVERVPGSELVAWLRPFQRSLGLRALFFGLAGLALVGSAVAVVLLLLGPAQFGLTPFLWLKASYSAVLGGAITPFIGLVALAEAEPRAQAS